MQNGEQLGTDPPPSLAKKKKKKVRLQKKITKSETDLSKKTVEPKQGYTKHVTDTRDGADNKKCIRMLRHVRKPCPHAAPHRIQPQLSSRCTAPNCKLRILQISTNIKKKISSLACDIQKTYF